MSPTSSGAQAPAAEAAPGPGPILAVVPCYNVGAACLPVLQGVGPYVRDVLAVDDGSTDDTPSHLGLSGTTVLTHPANRGKGAALLSAFRWALMRGYGAVLTLDGDGQHHPGDIPALLGAFEAEGADLVIGVRRVSWDAAPLRNWVGNALSGRAFSWISHTDIRDCQSGYRVYGARFLARVLGELQPGRYETEMKLLLYAAKNGYRLRSVPIRTIYDEESRRLSHFDPFRDTLRILASMARGLGGYTLAPKR